MRRFFISTLLIMLFIGCNPIDIDKELSKRDEQIAKLEELCGKISGDIESLKSLITALQNNDTVTSVTPIVIDGVEVGYTITFTKSEPITILHGTDGEDGEKFFHSITEDDEFVYLTLVDGTTITIQKGEKMLSNKIFYTTTNGSKLFPATTEPALFGAILISNTYRNGVGVMVFDDNISTIGEATFQNSLNLKSITIPDGVTEIGKNAFKGCSNLSEIEFGQGVQTIGESAFQDCLNLRSITIPRSVTAINAMAFYNCNSLDIVNTEDITAWCNIRFTETGSNPLSNGCRLFISGAESTNLAIPKGVTAIKSYAFDGCTNISNITLSSSVESIDECAFYYCTSLKSITIPDNTTNIAQLAFIGCSNLNSFHSSHASKDLRCLIVDNELKAFAPASLNQYTIPEGVTKIGSFTFSLCNELQHITLCNTLKTVGDYAFFATENLKSITIPDSVTNIGFSAFYYCASLADIDLNRVAVIDDNAFCGCSSLTEITIPVSVQSIGADAFSACDNLRAVYCKPSVPPIAESSSFDGNAAGRKIFVPRTSVDVYKQSKGWSRYAAAIEPYDF